MPENNGNPFTLTPTHLAACLTTLIYGPYADTDTADVAALTAETIRYLSYATPRGGVTAPATIAAITAHLATAAYQLPQLLTALGDRLNAGPVSDGHHRPPDQLTARIRDSISQAADHADRLAATLNTAHNLAATLDAADATVPAA